MDVDWVTETGGGGDDVRSDLKEGQVNYSRHGCLLLLWCWCVRMYRELRRAAACMEAYRQKNVVSGKGMGVELCGCYPFVYLFIRTSPLHCLCRPPLCGDARPFHRDHLSYYILLLLLLTSVVLGNCLQLKWRSHSHSRHRGQLPPPSPSAQPSSASSTPSRTHTSPIRSRQSP